MMILLLNVNINNITENYKKMTPREQNAKLSTATKIRMLNRILFRYMKEQSKQ